MNDWHTEVSQRLDVVAWLDGDHGRRTSELENVPIRVCSPTYVVCWWYHPQIAILWQIRIRRVTVLLDVSMRFRRLNRRTFNKFETWRAFIEKTFITELERLLRGCT